MYASVKHRVSCLFTDNSVLTASDEKLRSLGTSVVKSCNKKIMTGGVPTAFRYYQRACVTVCLTCKVLLPTYMHVFIHEDAEK